jgi:hypothetical protein
MTLNVAYVYYYSCNLTLQGERLYADIPIPNTSIYQIIDLIIPVDKWTEIAFSGRQNAENEYCETLKKKVHE